MASNPGYIQQMTTSQVLGQFVRNFLNPATMRRVVMCNQSDFDFQAKFLMVLLVKLETFL